MNKEMNFNELGLSEDALNAIIQKGFEEPTEIQSLTIPVMLRETCNIIAQAQTGTGKTAAFGLPLLDMIEPESENVNALVLVPTRELAIQVSEEIHTLRGKKNIRTVPIYGGQSIEQQFRRLKKSVQIIVGTPGRIIDHIRRRTLDFSKIDYLILDEADEMLNMGFIDDMEEIMKHTNDTKRTLLFSATMPERIKSLANKYMEGYKLLTVETEQLTTDLTEQIYFEVKASDKLEALCRIIDIEDNFYGLVFCRTKNDVDKLVNQLLDRGYDAEAIHGDINQARRERTLNKFKDMKINILVATDVAARGIDVINLTHVINYSLPHDAEAYVHRIGRTGRAGNEGTAITFITPSEYKRLVYIQKFANTDIKKSTIPDVEEIIKAKKQKIENDLQAIMDEKIEEKYFSWSKHLLKQNNPTVILASLLNYCFEDEINPEVYGTIKPVYTKEENLDKQGITRLFVARGKRDGINERSLVDMIMSRVTIKKRQIKDVQVLNNFSFINVPFSKAEMIIQSFHEKGSKPLITYSKDRKKKK